MCISFFCAFVCVHLQKTSASSDDGSLEGVVEQLTRFRSEVRAFALARRDSPGKAGLSPDRIPLLKACDALRNDLAPLGVILKVFWLWKTRAHVHVFSLNVTCVFMSLPHLQDRGAASTWEITAPTPSQKVQDEDRDRSTRDRPSDSNKLWIVSLNEFCIVWLFLDCRTSVTLMAGYPLAFNAVFDLHGK